MIEGQLANSEVKRTELWSDLVFIPIIEGYCHICLLHVPALGICTVINNRASFDTSSKISIMTYVLTLRALTNVLSEIMLHHLDCHYLSKKLHNSFIQGMGKQVSMTF